MRISGRVKKAYKWIRRQIIPGAVILMYHRVIELSSDPFGLSVSPENFRKHLAYLRKTCLPMHLLDLVLAVQRGSLPKRSVAVTFDDGYLDNYQYAFPHLKEGNVPATIFIVADHINRDREFWWDELERVILSSPHLPDRLITTFNGDSLIYDVPPFGHRMYLYMSLYEKLKNASSKSRCEKLKELMSWAGDSQITRPYYRPMNSKELAEITQGGLINLGAHTISHPYLPGLTPEDQYQEIVGSVKVIHRLTSQPVDVFAYPHGLFDETSIQIVRDAGLLAACTVDGRSIETGQDLYQLPRCYVGDWNIKEFRDNIEYCFLE
jgi:peptidoglycan/xylan/chitin deacetylase (PgdA/CDA1 family)